MHFLEGGKEPGKRTSASVDKERFLGEVGLDRRCILVFKGKASICLRNQVPILSKKSIKVILIPAERQ